MKRFVLIAFATLLMGSAFTSTAEARDRHRGHRDRDRPRYSYCDRHDCYHDCGYRSYRRDRGHDRHYYGDRHSRYHRHYDCD